MKKLFFFSLAGILISSFSFAKIFRVGYKGPKITGVDYATLQTAHDAAVVGDTLMFYPGNYSMSISQPATKRLVYLGFGYNLSGAGSNPNLQTITGDCIIDTWLNTTASGSIFEGIHSLAVRSNFGQNVDNIVIKRCGGANIGLFNTTGTVCNNWQISQCLSAGFAGAWDGGKATNFRYDNCIITGFNAGSSSEHTGLFNNCIFIPFSFFDINNNGIMFQNTIFESFTASNFSNSLFQHCLFSGSNPGITGSNNQFGVAFTGAGNSNSIFVGHPNVVAGETNDGKFKLKPGSPAIGAGISGVDLGIFGGPNPYRLSGIPSIPIIYKLEASSINATTNPFTVTFSTRSNN
jgi:hypothetical protein